MLSDGCEWDIDEGAEKVYCGIVTEGSVLEYRRKLLVAMDRASGENRPSCAFYQFSQKLSLTCKTLAGPEPEFVDDALSEVRAQITVFNSAVERLNHVVVDEKNREPFVLSFESKDVKELLQTFRQAKLARLAEVDQKYDVKVRQLQCRIDLQEKRQREWLSLSREIQSLSVINGFVSEYADAKDNRENIEAMLKSKKQDLEKINTLLATETILISDLQKEIKTINHERDEQKRLADTASEKEIKRHVDEINNKIALQRKLYFSSVSALTMLNCLRVYVSFIDLCAKAQLAAARFVPAQKASDTDESASCDFISRTQAVQLERHVHAAQREMTTFMRTLWCPQSGNRCGLEFYERFKKMNTAQRAWLFEAGPLSPAQVQSMIPEHYLEEYSLNDLRSVLVSRLPAALVANQSGRSMVTWLFGFSQPQESAPEQKLPELRRLAPLMN